MTEGPSRSEILLFKGGDGQTKIQVRLEDQSVWLPQRHIAELYQVSVKTVNEHLINIYEEKELVPEATLRKFRIVQTEGARRVERLIDHYNLDAILAVGYRVRSARGIQFRQWATHQLKEFLVKGFVMDDERLKEGQAAGADYFDELLARIRDIRTSERRFYQKTTDIYATSQDYSPSVELTQAFYATVQNKLHWAIHGQTAAEVIRERADAKRPNMGLTNWKSSPQGPIRKADIAVAKNYLTEEELSALNRIVTMYLDYAETQAERRIPMHMSDWIRKLDDFLKFNERNILTHAGKVSQRLASDHAESEFTKFEKDRLAALSTEPSSDFDQVLAESKRLVSPKARRLSRKDETKGGKSRKKGTNESD